MAHFFDVCTLIPFVMSLPHAIVNNSRLIPFVMSLPRAIVNNSRFSHVTQAEVQGQKITWLTPHALQQVLTDDVDFNVMLSFLEFYEVTNMVDCNVML